MMRIKVQIIFWRDMPAQVKLRAGRQRLSQQLPERFPVAIDAAAMQADKIGSDDYLAEWRNGPWQEHDGDPETVLAEFVAELESTYPTERLKKLIRQGGVEQVPE